MPFGRCECNPCEHDCAQPAKLRIIRERDEAREALAELNAAGLKQYREVNRLKAEVARLENLILDWDRMDMNGAGEEAVALEVEARRIRAAKGE